MSRTSDLRRRAMYAEYKKQMDAVRDDAREAEHRAETAKKRREARLWGVQGELLRRAWG